MFHPTKAAAWVKSKLSPAAAIKETDPAELQKLLWTEVEASLRQYLKALVEALLKEELDRPQVGPAMDRQSFLYAAGTAAVALPFEVNGSFIPKATDANAAPGIFDEPQRDPFRRAVVAGDLDTVKRLVRRDPALI